jgi:hypothetical protein
MKLFAHLLTLSVFLISCGAPSLRKAFASSQQVKLDDSTLLNLNGNYSVSSVIDSYHTLDQLFLFRSRKFKPTLDTNNHVVLKAQDSHHIRVTLYNRDSLLQTRILTGKISGGYFEYKSKSFIHVWIILNARGFINGRLGLLNNGDLITNSMYKGILFLFFVPVNGGDEQFPDLVFKRESWKRYTE